MVNMVSIAHRASRNLSGVMLALFLGGCSATLIVSSQPDGAVITETATGRVFGFAPVKIEYKSSALKTYRDADGCFLVNGFKARWTSGAESSVPLVKLCGSASGTYTRVLLRDPNHPDIERDIEAALLRQELRAAQAAAIEAQDAADNAAMNSMLLLNQQRQRQQYCAYNKC